MHGIDAPEYQVTKEIESCQRKKDTKATALIEMDL